MKKRSRKTFYNWLTNRYQLIIRNEENFAEKTTTSFTYAKVVVIGFFAFVFIFIASLYFGKYVLAHWYDPDYAMELRDHRLDDLASEMDMLIDENQRKAEYIMAFKKMLDGGETFPETIDSAVTINNGALEVLQDDSISRVDQMIRKEYSYLEGHKDSIDMPVQEHHELTAPFPYAKPLKEFSVKNRQFGAQIELPAGTQIKSISDGVVLNVSGNDTDGYNIMVQHSLGLVSIYRHTSQVLKKVGVSVKKGEPIARANGNLSGGNYVDLEVWVNGTPVNPLGYVKFK